MKLFKTFLPWFTVTFLFMELSQIYSGRELQIQLPIQDLALSPKEGVHLT